MNDPAAPTPGFRPPSALWVSVAAWLLVLAPVVALEWRSEPARWRAAAAAELLLDGKLAEAREAIDEALRMDPGSVQLLGQCALMLARMAQHERPWRQSPTSPGVTAAERTELLKQAEADLTQALEKMGGGSAFLQLRANVRLHLGDGPAAVDDWLAVQEAPGGISKDLLLNNLAYFRACAGLELEQALKEADESLGYQKEGYSEMRVTVLDTRGYIHHLLGNHEAAAKDLNQAVELYRTHVWDLWDREAMVQTAHDLRLVNQEEMRLHEELATMLYHRSLAVRESDPETAEEDQQEIRSLLPGYDGRALY